MLDLEKAYNILGLQKNESIEEIRDKYLKLAKKVHPDKYTNPVDNPLDISSDFILVKSAYEYLTEYIKSQKELGKIDDNSPFDGFVETVTTSDLDYDEDVSSYIYTCRCGHSIQLPAFKGKTSSCLTLACQTCSLKVKIT